MAKSTTDDPRGRWEFIRNLTESGQAWLFIVKDRTGTFPGEYVRKVLKTPSRLPRFQREVEVTNALAHAGVPVVPIVDAYLEPDGGERAYYVAPYYPHGDLRKSLERREYLGDLVRTLDLIEELYTLLREVHETTAHRDLKPENILLDESGRIRLCDFGICVPLLQDQSVERISETLEQMGSRHYIAPEALAGYKAVTNPIALDVYAVGKIVYEALAGTVLPGLELPTGEYNLALNHGNDMAWGIFNSIIMSLVSHDPNIRMSAWERLPQLIALLRRVLHGDISAGDPDLAEAQLRRRFEDSEDSKRRRIISERMHFREGLCSAIVQEFLENPVVQRIRSLASDLNNVFSVECETTLGEEGVAQLTFGPPLAGSVRDGMNLPHLTGRTSDANPLWVRVAVDLQWCSDGSLTVHFILHTGKQEGGVWRYAGHPPVVESLEKGRPGDEAFLAEAMEKAREMAGRWAELFLRATGASGE
jgi:serine/threonine protein kinase